MPDNQSNDRKEEKISAEQTEITHAAEPCEAEITDPAETTVEGQEETPDEIPDTIPEEHPAEATEVTDAESADESHDTEVPEVAEPAAHCPDPGASTENKDEKRKSSRRGALVYAAIMTAAFLVCFALLIAITVTAPPADTPDYTPVETVVIEKTVYVREGDSTGKLTIAEIASKVGPSVVGIGVRKKDAGGVGTGIIKTEDGYIITNYHVIEDYTSIEVFMPDGASYPAEYIGGNELSDIAVIKIDATGLPAADFGNSDGLVVGETAVAIGTPGGLEYAGTVTTGIISSTRRTVRFYDNTTGLLQKTMTLIQTSTQINPGNSGGPIVNLYGQVVGIATAKIVSEKYEGMGFAIPSATAKDIIDKQKKKGYVEGRVKIGITGSNVSSDFASAYGVPKGIMVDEISKDGPCYGTELKTDDIITGVDDKEIQSFSDIYEILETHKPGDKIVIKYYRMSDQSTGEVEVTLAEDK